MLPAYAELHCRSNFSFLSGASHPEELVARAQRSATRRWPSPTNARSPAWCARTPRPSALGLHLIVGARCGSRSGVRRQPMPRAGARAPRAAGADAPRLRQPVAVDHRGAPPCAQGRSTSRTRPTSKAGCPTRPRWPACPTAWRCWCPRRAQPLRDGVRPRDVAEDLVRRASAPRSRSSCCTAPRRRAAGRRRAARGRSSPACPSWPRATC